MAQKASSENKFVGRILPWIIAASVIVLYLVTLNHWVSFNSLFHVAQVSGWTWYPETTGPIYCLVTYPFRWLPVKLIPVALNLLATLCAGLTLATLARSVALLPHDRTEDQRIREKSPFALLSIPTAWLPPVLAVLICGLQLTFWEHATVASREMLDLLLFAYVIRCLLEFRVVGKESWLFRASFIYGLGMTENWAMIGFFPLFLAAMVWIQGVGFFQGRFLGRMFMFGLAGLSFYLLLPIVNSLPHSGSITFWQALRDNIAWQKQYLFRYAFSKTVLLHGSDPLHGDRPLWVLALPSLLPLLVMGIRWPSYFGDPSKLGVSLTTLIFHFVHAVLLVVCAWVALDPEKFSPRNLLPDIPLLTLYYLGALALGYYCGYFLLIFGTKPAGRPRPVPFFQPLVNRVVLAGVWLLAILVPILLVSRNLRQIHITNGPLLREYTALVEKNLPKESSYVLCDDPSHLLLTQSALVQDGLDARCLLLDTKSLEWPEYHRFLARKHPGQWSNSVPKERRALLTPPELTRLTYRVAETNKLYYLHPSFGYYFEVFYPEAQGLLYRLNPYPTNTLLVPRPRDESVAENERFWSQIDDPILKPLTAIVQPASVDRDPSALERIAGWARLGKQPNRDAFVLAKLFSRALNWWGAKQQQLGHLKEAGTHFARAFELKPDTQLMRGNIPAQINLQFNQNLQSGTKTSIPPSKSLEDQFGKYRGWDDILRENGPFDEPTSCFQQGREFARGGNYRQAALEFARVCELAPDNLASRLMVAYLEISYLGMPDGALDTVSNIETHADVFSLDRTNWSTLTTISVSAHLAKNDLSNAQNAVQTALNKYQDDEDILGSASRAYIQYGYYSNALEMLERQLKIQPDDLTLLVNKGFACLQLSAYDDAIAALTRVVDSETKKLSELYYRALWNRAIAYLRSEKLDLAQHDYDVLQRAAPSQFQFYYGLGEIAFRKKDTNSAMRFYRLYLANAPTNSSEATTIAARLDEMKKAVAARRRGQ